MNYNLVLKSGASVVISKQEADFIKEAVIEISDKHLTKDHIFVEDLAGIIILAKISEIAIINRLPEEEVKKDVDTVLSDKYGVYELSTDDKTCSKCVYIGNTSNFGACNSCSELKGKFYPKNK